MRRVELRRPILGRLVWGWIGFAGLLILFLGWLVISQANKPKIGRIALNIDENATRLAPANNPTPELRLTPPETANNVTLTPPSLTTPSLASSSTVNRSEGNYTASNLRDSTASLTRNSARDSKRDSGPKTYKVPNNDINEDDNRFYDNEDEDTGELIITIDGVNIDDAKPKKVVFKKVETIKPVNQPISSLLQTTQYGAIPRIDKNGLRSARFYARQHQLDPTKKHVAFIVGGLGLNAELTQFAIDTLPGEITLAFAPYGKDLDQWTEKARANGHEVILEIPMEGYGKNAAEQIGPAGLLTSHDPSDNQKRLDWVLSRSKGYFGVTNYQGGRFSADETVMKPVLERITSLGLAYIDDTGAAKKPNRNAPLLKSRTISSANQNADSNKMKADLIGLREVALKDGSALGKIIATHESITVLQLHLDEVEDEEVSLAPASALLYAQ